MPLRPPRQLAAHLLTAAALAVPGAAAAQATRTVSACTLGTLRNCAEVRLTATPGAGAGGATLLEVALRNAGSLAAPALPTSIYNLVLGTGRPDAPGEEVGAAVVPVALGGAVLTDPAEWDLFDSGGAVFLSSLGNFGVGGCAAGAPVGAFGQAGRTCAAGEFLAFSYPTSRAYDLAQFSLLSFEAVGLTAGLPADSYDASVVPEPTAALLLAPALLGVAALGRHGRRRHHHPVRRPRQEA